MYFLRQKFLKAIFTLQLNFEKLTYDLFSLKSFNRIFTQEDHEIPPSL